MVCHIAQKRLRTRIQDIDGAMVHIRKQQKDPGICSRPLVQMTKRAMGVRVMRDILDPNCSTI